MTRTLLRAGVLLVAGSSAMAAAAEPQAGIRTVYVTVTGRDGLPVAGLSRRETSCAGALSGPS